MARRCRGAPKAKGSRQPATTQHETSAAVSPRMVVFAVLAAVAVRWALEHGYDRFFELILRRSPSSTVDRSSDFDGGADAQRIASFLTWFEEMGGSLSPNVTLGSFPEFGGYGLMAAPRTTSSARDEGYAVRHMDDMFTVPSSIITSARSTIDGYSDLDPSFRRRVESAVQRLFPSAMVQQDVVIALSLMAECSLGKWSKMKPYLRILPDDVPRLDTFNQNELDLLQDAQLATLARQSKHQLSYAWENGGLKEISELMSTLAAKDTGIGSTTTKGLADFCLSFDSFHRYVAIVSSRAMVMKGVKYLTPLADMANYSPRNDNRTAGLSESFMLYHHRGLDGSITVRADRNVEPGSQIFEDYGDTDNSLYLEAHGFVPASNPFHCAMISPEYLPQPASLPKELVDVQVRLGIISRDSGVAPDLCLTAQGSPTDARASAYLKTANLAENDAQLQYCIDASLTGDAELATLQCTRYRGHVQSLKRTIRQMARSTYCNATSTIEEDEMLLQAVEEDLSGAVRPTIAIKFRIAEKMILTKVGEVADLESACAVDDSGGEDNGSGEDVSADKEDADFRDESESKIKAELSKNLEDFVEFVDSTLDLPVKKIKPAFVGDGMRLGAVATENFAKGEAYLSIAADSSVISIDTAKVREEHPSIQPLLDRYRAASDDGGFRTLLLYLIHEQFVAKEDNRSMWVPYLNLLPTIQEMKKSHPLFFHEERLDYLSGSDLRTKILRYQRTAANMFSYIASDYQVVRALGAEVALDREKFLWAYAILDSRSIWWDGKRHLVPLLDLVNCREILDNEGKSNEVHRTAMDESGRNAITRSTADVNSGDQVYENYGQPNYVYFIFHGFILENNTHDCALWDELSIDSNDHVVKDMDLLKSRLASNGFNQKPTFCIRADKASLGRVADFLRIKFGVEGNNVGLDADDVLEKLKEAISKRLHRYEHLAPSPERLELGYAERAMVQIVENEKRFFSESLQFLESRQ